MPEKGKHSVGVAPQYATVSGKQANCQALVSLTLARHAVPVPLALRLYLPEVWSRIRLVSPKRRFRSRSDSTAPSRRSPWPNSTASWRLRPLRGGAGRSRLWQQRCVPARALSARSDVGGRDPAPEVELTWPVAPRGSPRQRPVPDIRPLAAQDMLPLQTWRTITWRRGTEGPPEGGLRSRAGRGWDAHARRGTLAPAP
jgi:DDE superfamily endonuclease